MEGLALVSPMLMRLQLYLASGTAQHESVNVSLWLGQRTTSNAFVSTQHSWLMLLTSCTCLCCLQANAVGGCMLTVAVYMLHKGHLKISCIRWEYFKPTTKVTRHAYKTGKQWEQIPCAHGCFSGNVRGGGHTGRPCIKRRCIKIQHPAKSV
jgi:hypothetical protein